MSDKRLKIYDQDLRRLVFSEIYQRFSDPKGLRKAMSLMEAALKCLAKSGFENVTLEMIAREAGVTRPLIRHYFKDLNELRQVSIMYIRLLFQKIAIDSMVRAQRPRDMFVNYVDACFFWTENFGTHMRVWFAFLLDCTQDKKSRAMNTAAVRAGEERIQTLLEKGKQVGDFEFVDSAAAAKMVQSLITGGLITYVSEDLADAKKYREEVCNACLAVLSTK